MSESKKSLVEGIARFFNKSDHADVKINLGQYEFPAHSVVLASQSLFFHKSLGQSFREGKSKEFHFKEGSAHAHWRVLEYMYTGNYVEEPAKVLNIPDDDELVKDVRVYVTAEFFMLDHLKQHALERFESKLQKLWVSELFVDCIREVYDTTTELEHGLRNAVVEVALTHRAELWGKSAFRDLVHEGGDFAVDLMGRFCSGRYY
ncbi:hypothetical protein NUW58_g4446 [Xylaria curta]|uniref:Uncharacterized protein n=1 Tax=Xylaria curta TaxID=42375 RepID=A0ACC1P7U9_9PEZI|nr:hypothetical protein NUW58_g4446 [Xylaria curta]